MMVAPLPVFSDPSPLASATPTDEMSAPDAPAAPSDTLGGDFWSRPKLTGHWGGLRDQWASRGFTVDLDAVYTLLR